MKNKEKATAIAKLRVCFSLPTIWMSSPSVLYFLFIFLRETEYKENALLTMCLRPKENNKIK